MEKIRLGVPHRTRMTSAELLQMVEDEDGTGSLGVEEMVASFADNSLKGKERSLLVDAIGSTLFGRCAWNHPSGDRRAEKQGSKKMIADHRSTSSN